MTKLTIILELDKDVEDWEIDNIHESLEQSEVSFDILTFEVEGREKEYFGQ